MVSGFEDYTTELTEFELKRVLPLIVRSWKTKIPDKDILNMSDMIRQTNEYLTQKRIGSYSKKGAYKKYQVTGPRMRKFIHYIRVKNLVPNLIATSKGYFLTEDKEKVDKFIKSCIERANSFTEVARAMEVHNQVY